MIFWLRRGGNRRVQRVAVQSPLKLMCCQLSMSALQGTVEAATIVSQFFIFATFVRDRLWKLTCCAEQPSLVRVNPQTRGLGLSFDQWLPHTADDGHAQGAQTARVIGAYNGGGRQHWIVR